MNYYFLPFYNPSKMCYVFEFRVGILERLRFWGFGFIMLYGFKGFLFKVFGLNVSWI